MIPKGWDKKSFQDAAIKIIDGDRGTNYPKQNDYSSQGNCLFLNAKNVTKKGFQFDELQFITEDKHNQLRKGEVLKGDIVLTTRGTVGCVGLFNDKVKFSKMRINSGMVILRNENPSLSTEYLYKVLTSTIIGQQISTFSFGSAQPQLTVAIIKKLEIPIPPLKEQIKIAKILSTWDEAVSKINLMIKKKEKRKKFILEKLFSIVRGQNQFKELEQIAEVLPSNVDKKSNPKEESVKLCNYVDVYKNNKISNGLDFMDATATSLEIKKFSIKKDDVIITKDSETPQDIAIPSYVSENISNLVCGYHLTLIRCNPKLILGHYLYYYFLTSRSKYYFFTRANGATRFGLSADSVKECQIPLIGLLEQSKIIATLDTAEIEILTLKSYGKRLELQKKALMQQLLTGKKRMKF